MNKNEQLFLDLFKDKYNYYKQWYHSIPIIITPERNNELRKIQQIMVKCAQKFATCYENYEHIMPLENKIKEILKHYKNKPYKPGTFRLDILLGIDGSLKVCEITSRFWCAGYLVSYFADMNSEKISKKHHITDRKKEIEGLIDYVANTLGNKKNVIVLRTTDKKADIYFYKPYFEALGAKVNVVQLKDIENYLNHFHDSLIVTDFNQLDLLKLDTHIIKQIIDADHVNDFRTLYLIHDKRFFSILFEESFLRQALTEEEIIFFKDRIVRTYSYQQDKSIWEDAIQNKNKYILKPARLGKSENVFAGCVTPQNKWEDIFKSKDITQMIIQPFIKQRQFKVSLYNNTYYDYAVATLLCINDKYYGPGVFRASDFIITNQGDDRKFTGIITNQGYKINDKIIL